MSKFCLPSLCCQCFIVIFPVLCFSGLCLFLLWLCTAFLWDLRSSLDTMCLKFFWFAHLLHSLWLLYQHGGVWQHLVQNFSWCSLFVEFLASALLEEFTVTRVRSSVVLTGPLENLSVSAAPSVLDLSFCSAITTQATTNNTAIEITEKNGIHLFAISPNNVNQETQTWFPHRLLLSRTEPILSPTIKFVFNFTCNESPYESAVYSVMTRSITLVSVSC